MTWMTERWMRMPKGVRFLLYYGLWPLWAPSLMVALAVVLVLYYPINTIYEAWRDFDND